MLPLPFHTQTELTTIPDITCKHTVVLWLTLAHLLGGMAVFEGLWLAYSCAPSILLEHCTYFCLDLVDLWKPHEYRYDHVAMIFLVVCIRRPIPETALVSKAR